jgi:uncharacterized membrane protein
MTDAPQTGPGQPRIGEPHASQGKPAAIIAWALYILSIPSANLLVIVGLIVAYAGRGSATGVAREHIEAQIRLFWSVFWWTIGLWIVTIISFVTVILFPLGLIGLLLLFGLHVWFTVKSVISLINLGSDRAP